METYREIYDVGFDYYHNTISLVESNRFGEALTANVAVLSAEYLLSSVLTKNNIPLYGHGLSEMLKALCFNRIIPPKVRDQVKILDQGCGCNALIPTADEVVKLVDALREVKQWTDTQIKVAVSA